MKSESGSSGFFDLRAVGTGVLWGLGLMLLGSILQGMIGFGRPLSSGMEDVMSLVWQIAGSLLGGYLAARKASGSGWLHGAVSGMALILSIAAVMGVVTAPPTLAVLLKMTGLGSGVGALGGIAGVNAGTR